MVPMSADVARLDLRLRRRSVLGYALGVGAYSLVVAAIYPSFEHSSSLNDLTKGGSKLAALFGVTGSLTSPAGWLNANIYQNFFPLIVFLVTIGYGASSIAGLNEQGLLALQVALPLTRRRVVLEKAAALAAQAFFVAAAVAVCVVPGRWFDITVSPAHIVATSAAAALAGIDLGLVALVAGAATGSRGAAIAVGGTVATLA
jgi:ABC-2 type transport system permease protein